MKLPNKDIVKLEEAYREIKHTPSTYVPSSIKDKLLDAVGNFFGNASTLEDTLSKVKGLLTSTNIRSKTDIPFRDFLAREKGLKESLVEEGVMDSFAQFKSKFTNFSFLEIIRLFHKLNSIMKSYSNQEIEGMEAIEAVAAAYNKFKDKAGFTSTSQPTVE